TLFSLTSSLSHRALHSFPTRRSSDLRRGAISRRVRRLRRGSRPRARDARNSDGYLGSRKRRDAAPARTRAAGGGSRTRGRSVPRSEEHTSELQSLRHLVCRLLLEKKK